METPNTNQDPMDFLIEYSGLQKDTIENSYKWVIKAMEAFVKQCAPSNTLVDRGERISAEQVLYKFMDNDRTVASICRAMKYYAVQEKGNL